jgi:putative oxidoreductase
MDAFGGSGAQRQIDLGLLVLRVVAGLVFFMHGYQKLFDNGISATQAGFDAMGAPLPEVTAIVVTFLELAGGLALIVGAATRVIAVLLAVDMASAYAIVHAENGFFASNGGFELVLLLAGAAVTLALTGAGAFSADGAVGVPGRSRGQLTARRA